MAHALPGHPLVEFDVHQVRHTTPTPPKESDLDIHLLDEAYVYGQIVAVTGHSPNKTAAASIELDQAIGKIRLLVAGLGGSCALTFYYLIHFLG